MTVGELSRLTGVHTKNLRAYTDWGLVYSVGRTAANYRLYDGDALWCVSVISELRGLGLTLAEIREVTGAYLERRADPIGPHLADLLDRSRCRIRRQIEDLQAVADRIDDYVSAHGEELRGRGAGVWAGDPRAGPDRA